MLTIDSILKVTRQQRLYGEGKHRFGTGTESLHQGRIPRDPNPEIKTAEEPSTTKTDRKESP